MKKLREKIGLSITDMAKLIGTSKTTSSLYEKGLRDLNHKALNSLSIIELAMENTAEVKASEKISLNEQKAVAALLKKLSYQQKRAIQRNDMLNEQLVRMEEAYAGNQKLWCLLNELKKQSRGKYLNPYVDVLEVRCLEKQQSCGIDQQILLRHQITTVQAEIDSIQSVMEQYQYIVLTD